MNNLRLLLRTLWHFRLVNAGMVLSAAVCAMALIGALVVGDSIKDSLRRIVEKRLGDIDYTIESPRFFTADLTQRLERAPSFNDSFIDARPYLTTTGVCLETRENALAAQVNVIGSETIPTGGCVISRRLAEQLHIEGDVAGTERKTTVVVRMDPKRYVSAGLPVGRDRTDTALLRLTVLRISDNGDFEDAFSLYGSQRPVKNIWTSLSDLQSSLDAPGAANLIAVSRQTETNPLEGAERLKTLLAESSVPEDYGLFFRQGNSSLILSGPSNDLIIESSDLLLPVAAGRALESAFPDSAASVLAYVVDTIRRVETGAECPYALAAGVSRLPDGDIPDGAVVLNQWSADDLGAQPGDRIVFEYVVRDPSGLPVKRTAEFIVDRLISMDGIGADRTLVPDYKMITTATSLADWTPPRDFEFRSERIRPIDDEYWRLYRASPRAFVNIQTAERLWGTAHGIRSSVRFNGISESDIRLALSQNTLPADMGLTVRPIRYEQLTSASGNTDFAQLFLGLGSFLVASAALLLALIALLLVEQRARQIGLLFALGFTARKVRRLLLAEGLLLIIAGASIGAAGSLGYAWLVLTGFKTIWRDAIDSTILDLSIRPGTLAAGWAVSVLICAVVIGWGIARVSRLSISATLAGKRIDDSQSPNAPLRPPVALTILLVIGGVASIGGVLGFWIGAAGFFIGGAALLAASLVHLSRRFARARQTRSVSPSNLSLVRLGVRNAARHPTRSMLMAGLLASSLFVVVIVSIMKPQRIIRSDNDDLALLAAFDIPLPYDLNEPQGRRLLGLPDSPLWENVRFVNLRSASGDDVSCLNLYRATQPRITSAPKAMATIKGLRFASSLDDSVDPWTLLDKPFDDGAIPAIADYDSAQWILHKRLGDTITVTDETGTEKRLRLVALLSKSVFQGEVLVSEPSFKSLFPARAGYDQVLVLNSPERTAEVKETLAKALGDFGAQLETPEERLASYSAISTAYMSAFEALGGLGVILGSFGLLVVLVRGIAERRGEIALLFALGFSRQSVIRLLTAENGFLLAYGLAAGALSALFAAIPEFVRTGVNLGNVLSTVLLLGIIGGVISLLLVTGGRALVKRISADNLRLE
ncbi:MAG: ABC transporter permease [Planctomycetota bacterium]